MGIAEKTPAEEEKTEKAKWHVTVHVPSPFAHVPSPFVHVSPFGRGLG